MARTPVISAKRRVSSESVGMPADQPLMLRRPVINWNGEASMGSGVAPITSSVPLGPNPSIKFRHRFGAGGGSENHARATHFLQRLRGVGSFAVEILRGAQFFGALGVFRAAADGHGAISKFVGELNSQMAEATDSQHGHEVTGHGAAAAQRVEGGDAGAKQWRSFRGVQRFGHRRQRL